MTSSYADFVFGATVPPELAVYQYALDDPSDWSNSGPTVRVGPLSSGNHTVFVRMVADDGHGGWLIGSGAAFTWTVVALSNSTISLSSLSDGAHSLKVTARDSVGHVEAAPRVYNWVVDTTPPDTVATLSSPALANRSVGVVNTACGSEALPSLCTVCWRLSVNGVASSTGCGPTGPLSLAVPVDGSVSVAVTAIDGAGNHGQSVSVGWQLDSTPPVTSAVITSPTMFVPALHANAINTTEVTLLVNASEPVLGYHIMLRRQNSAPGDSSTVQWMYNAVRDSPDSCNVHVANPLWSMWVAVLHTVSLFVPDGAYHHTCHACHGVHCHESAGTAVLVALFLVRMLLAGVH